ncbi:MAG TPA: type II toxin-antitoxin system RelE/ParE family toxin [Nitrospiria bacterium]|nr:type II toxin-antitoxin system RelE/ParE family toxin [Nitrospiria bacterium]
MYRLVIKKPAMKELDVLSDEQFSKIDSAILSLKDNPYPHPASIKLKGEEKRRIRVGDFRVIYTVDEADKIVTIHRVRHRKDSYR